MDFQFNENDMSQQRVIREFKQSLEIVFQVSVAPARLEVLFIKQQPLVVVIVHLEYK